jgi:hypothetical protein
VNLPPEKLPPEEQSPPIVILPEETRGEMGIYSGEFATLAKRLRAQGLEVSYQHDAEHRLWRGHKGGGVVTPLDIEVAVAVPPDAFFFALQQLIDWKKSRDPIKLQVTHRVDGESTSAPDVFEGEGAPDRVIAAFRAFEKERGGAG